jgi:hypothetical protein
MKCFIPRRPDPTGLSIVGSLALQPLKRTHRSGESMRISGARGPVCQACVYPCFNSLHSLHFTSPATGEISVLGEGSADLCASGGPRERVHSQSPMFLSPLNLECAVSSSAVCKFILRSPSSCIEKILDLKRMAGVSRKDSWPSPIQMLPLDWFGGGALESTEFGSTRESFSAEVRVLKPRAGRPCLAPISCIRASDNEHDDQGILDDNRISI